MNTSIKILLFAVVAFLVSCKQNTDTSEVANDLTTAPLNISPPDADKSDSMLNIVQIVADSKDHTTLLLALKKAELVDALSNAGPYTFFAPTNAAFAKLSDATMEDLLQAEKLEDLENIIGYHTYVGVLKTEYMQDADEFDMVYGGKIKITKTQNHILVNGSVIVASFETTNGIVHIIEDILLPN